MFLAFKLSEIFILPTLVAFLLLVVGFFAKSRGWIGIGILIFYFFSSGFAPALLMRPLERPYQSGTIERPCLSGSAVLLVGGFEEDVERAAPAVALSKTCGKNFHLIISGIDPLVIESMEAHDLKNLLVAEGIPPQEITIEERSRITRESAQNLRTIFDEKPFYLLTSPYHMTRSLYSFRSAGLKPVPFTIPFRLPNTLSLLDFIPSSANLNQSDKALHEYAGIIMYHAHDFWMKRRNGK